MVAHVRKSPSPAESPTPTPLTQQLIALLRGWTRQRISAALFEEPDAAASLANGQLAVRLSRVPGRDTAYAAGGVNGTSDMNAAAVGYFDDEYPPLLRFIPDPPLVLYYRGDLGVLDEPGIAVVGARKCTSQGRLNAETLARELAQQGVQVISGLALGIDGAAHRGALAAGQPGATVAVLGAGLGQIYPHRHQSLAAQIVASGGLLLSEYPASVRPLPHQFPERNRLISGLSLATVVVEASLRSGSLITARFAAEQGRDVLAMPGPVQSLVSQGCHRLLQQGAGLVTNAGDALDNAGLEPHSRPESSSVPTVKLSEDAVLVLAQLQGYPVSLDELLASTGMPTAQLTAAVVELELDGFVAQGPLGYIRTS